MAQVLTGASHRQELVNVIREVRHRWRMKLLVRGAIIIVVVVGQQRWPGHTHP